MQFATCTGKGINSEKKNNQIKNYTNHLLENFKKRKWVADLDDTQLIKEFGFY